MSDEAANSSRSSSPGEGSGRVRRSRGVMALASVVCGLGIAVSGVTFVRAADDAGLLDFFRSQALHRFVDPFRLRPRYESEPRFVYRPQDEVRRRDARRQARRDESRRAAQKRASADRLADARQPRPGLSDPARSPVARKARLELAGMGAAAMGRRTMCVRTCDGYLFPLGTLHSRSDLQTHGAACSAACPGAETRLYTLAPGQQLEDPSGARSVLDGTVYARLKTAFLFRKQTVASCDCQPPGRIASHLPILLDPTLRRGDIVVDQDGEAKAFAGSDRMPRQRRAFASYEGSPVLTRRAKAQVDRLMGTSVRRRIAADYERSERQRLAALRPNAPLAEIVQPLAARARHASFSIREVAAPAGSGAGVRAYSFGQGGSLHASGARIITVQ